MAARRAAAKPCSADGQPAARLMRHPLQALALPKDWAVLYHTHGLRSFLAVPIGTANETLGLLTVAKQQPHSFDDEWCAFGGGWGMGIG
jgi:GAF domain-containing protein